jgi:hypothetical protein
MLRRHCDLYPINPPAPPACSTLPTLKSHVEWKVYDVLNPANKRTVVTHEGPFPAIHIAATQDERPVGPDANNLQCYTNCRMSGAWVTHIIFAIIQKCALSRKLKQISSRWRLSPSRPSP